ncbi:hypothetical protein [Bradyrhizobium sp.]|jgi:hypothetical protein|uniref:hypothetical protein n=1 Tax=Bradyrhizobium sp. TaxID=376 RepID=UPI002E04DF31|nr:hypothetical protein [Bradyrhizobium sp.]
MTTVFLSGSRTISRLNDLIRFRLKNVIDQRFDVIIGDANGADKALQGYLAESCYEKVVVFCVGSVCRNNIGNWPVRNIDVDSKLKGRDFYTQKDKAMALESDYGFVLWDGKSASSINNVLELMKNGKAVVVYYGPDKTFHILKQANDVQMLLRHCDESDYRSINNKIHFVRRLEDLRGSLQPSFNL